MAVTRPGGGTGHDRYWMRCKPYVVRITGGRFWGEYGQCIAHDGQMRIVILLADQFGDETYRIHWDHIEIIEPRAA